MITKNVEYGVSTGVTWAEFGKGTVLVSAAKTEGGEFSLVCFKSSDAKPIGSDGGGLGTAVKETKQDIIFSFTNPKSVDVVIRALIEAKAHLSGFPSDEEIIEDQIINTLTRQKSKAGT